MRFLPGLQNRINEYLRKRKYPRRKVLVLEGGGMRGIFLTGVLQAFADRNYYPFDLIVGASAGALVGTSYAAGQVFIARDAFFSKLLTGKFIHFRNILRQKQHVLDLDWFIDSIMTGEEQVDIDRVRHSCPVLIAATDCQPYKDPKTVYLDSRRDDIATALKATAAIPFLYRGFIEYGGYQLLDGGVLDPIPFKKALSLGYREKDILVVVTRPYGYRKKEESVWIRSLYERYYKNDEYRYLVRAIENRWQKYNRVLDELEKGYRDIDVIYPPRVFPVGRLTRDEKKILEGFNEGVQAGIRYLSPGSKSPEK